MTSPVEPAMESNVVPPPFAFGAQGPPSQEVAGAAVQSRTASYALPAGTTPMAWGEELVGRATAFQADAKVENLKEYKERVAK